jgi:hypothetical protein
MTQDNKTRYLIRFRSFNRDNGTLYKWDYYEDYPLKKFNATAPQEFTGVCDKNLRDIYVGDIVNYNNENYLVRFRYGAYMLWKLENISTLKFWWFHDVFDKFGEMEVVGNTFENAEYLVDCLNKQNEFEFNLNLQQQ